MCILILKKVLQKNLFSEIIDGSVVLEIGIGNGASLPRYPQNISFQLIGLEPNEFSVEILHNRTKDYPRINITVLNSFAEYINLEKDSVDFVVSHHVLCSVGDIIQALNEIKRILKPGGKFFFVEHVAAHQEEFIKKTTQDILFYVWLRIGGGCHTNRPTWEYIADVFGKESISITHYQADIPIPFLTPHIRGYAIKK